jgi:hypothetical protein
VLLALTAGKGAARSGRATNWISACYIGFAGSSSVFYGTAIGPARTRFGQWVRTDVPSSSASIVQSLEIIEWLHPKDRPISASIYDAVADKYFSHLDYADLWQPDSLERWHMG